jgi:hypothetical protein
MLLNFHPFYAADGGGASGDEDDDPDERVRSEDIINRSSNAQDTIARLGRELDRNETRRFNLRAERRTLREQVAAVPEGARVLTKDEAKAYEAYLAFGKSPDELKQALDANGEATAKLAKLERQAQIRIAAEAHGYRAGLLSELRSLDGKSIETREIEEQGSKVKRSFVKDGDVELSLPDFLSKQAPDAVGALTLDSSSTGTGYVTQSTGDKQPPQNAAQAYINQRYKGAT